MLTCGVQFVSYPYMKPDMRQDQRLNTRLVCLQAAGRLQRVATAGGRGPCGAAAKDRAAGGGAAAGDCVREAVGPAGPAADVPAESVHPGRLENWRVAGQPRNFVLCVCEELTAADTALPSRGL